MGTLHEHFENSGYTYHRRMISPERLPQCCREHLVPLPLGIKYLKADGGENILPLVECAVCGRKLAQCGSKFVVVEHLLQFEVIPLSL